MRKAYIHRYIDTQLVHKYQIGTSLHKYQSHGTKPCGESKGLSSFLRCLPEHCDHQSFPTHEHNEEVRLEIQSTANHIICLVVEFRNHTNCPQQRGISSFWRRTCLGVPGSCRQEEFQHVFATHILQMAPPSERTIC